MPRFSYMLLICAVWILSIPHINAQKPIKLNIRPQVDPDTADLMHYGKPRFWQATAMVAGSNIALWGYDRFIQRGDYAYISLHSIKENFKHGFIWDNDHMGTNMFLHPYNGSLFFNAARSNGFNYWKSGLFALGGSAMWELFMEREYPSTNDIIATPIGGMAIGEVCYRMSDIVLDDRATGSERGLREAAAFVISPMRGLTRIINGDAWRHRSTTGRQFGIPPIGVEISSGFRILSFKNRHAGTSKSGFTMELNMEYGDRFEGTSRQPYDYFTFRSVLNIINTQPVLSQLNIKGRLLSRELLETRDQFLSVGMYQHFDFYDSDTISEHVGKCPYKLGVPASAGVGVMFRDIERRGWVFDAYAHANGVFLGAILSDHYQVDERNYNLASGFSLKGGAHLVFDHDRFSASISHEYYRLFTWKGYKRGTNLRTVDYHTLNVQGDKSSAAFGVTELRVDLKLWRKLYISLGISHYYRSTRYRDFPDVKSSAISESVILTYKL